MLCVFMLLSPPMPFALMPFLALAFLNAVHAYADTLTPKLPAFLGSRLTYFKSEEGIFQVHAFGAVSEVIVTFMSPLLIVVQGLRAGLIGFFYFQYVVRRYRSNQATVQTVQMLVEKIDGVLKHRYAPAFLQNVYVRLKRAVG